MQQASTSPPSAFKMWTSTRILQHFFPETMQRDSRSTAEDLLIALSRRRLSTVSAVEGLHRGS